MVFEINKTTLALLGGYIGGMADKKFNSGTYYTMYIYMNLEKLDFNFLVNFSNKVQIPLEEVIRRCQS